MILNAGSGTEADRFSNLVSGRRGPIGFHVSDKEFKDTESSIGASHDRQNNVFRTNVQGWDDWITEQDAAITSRLAKYTREDYYSILDDLYKRLNPSAAKGLIIGVRQSQPTLEWLDHAIVVNTALIRRKEGLLSPQKQM